MKRCMLSALAIAAGALVVTACGDDDDDSAGEASQDLCTSMGDLQATVAGVAGADIDLATVTVGDVDDGLDELEDQIEAIQEDRGDLAESVVSSLADAYDAYRDSIDDISDDDTLAEAGAEVAAAQTAFRESWDQTLAELNCGPSTT